MANYVSSHTGAEIDFAVGKANILPVATAAAEGDVMVFKNGTWSPLTLVEVMLENGFYTPNLATDSWATISAVSASGNAACGRRPSIICPYLLLMRLTRTAVLQIPMRRLIRLSTLTMLTVTAR